MKSKTLVRVMTLILAISLCMVSAIPAFAATDAVAPLASLTVGEGYTLSPSFQQNTQVYTVKGGTAIPANLTDALGIVSYTLPEGTTVANPDGLGYDIATGMLTITTTAGGNSSVYYISFAPTPAITAQSNIADINVKKVLEAEATAPLDSLTFSYELTPVTIVDKTTNVGSTVTTPPLANPVTDANDADGTVTVSSDTSKSTMIMTDWEKTGVPKLSNEDAAAIGKTDLAGNKVLDGTFSVKYTAVGQYVYVLHEVTGDTAGVTYDDSYYEVTVSVVHSDPNEPASDPVVGWIEVKKITSFTDKDNYVVGDKVNFGTDVTIDGNKYDHVTTSITYPFINTLATEDLVINKTVTGDLADANQEFLFELTVNGTGLAASYAISYTNNATGTKPTSIGTNGSTGSVLFTLKHGVTATVAKLPTGATYTIEELTTDKNSTLASATEAANYNTTVTYDKTVTAEKVAVQQMDVGKKVTDQAILNTAADKNTVTVFNDKPLTPPTGSFVDMLPYIAIAAVAVGGFVTFIVVRKRRNAYED